MLQQRTDPVCYAIEKSECFRQLSESLRRGIEIPFIKMYGDPKFRELSNPELAMRRSLTDLPLTLGNC
jgi:hypothetical protein